MILTKIKSTFSALIKAYYNSKLLKVARYGNYNGVKEYLAAGADINVKDSKLGFTPLIIALEGNHLEIAQFLLESGADVNIKDKYGFTALMIASWRNHKEIAQLLLQAGANANAKTNSGATALMSAAYKGHLEITQFLLQSGADANIKNDKSRTAGMYAHSGNYLVHSEGHPKIIELIESEVKKNKYIGELRKNARLINQCYRNKINTSQFTETEFNALPEQIKNNIFLSLPEDLLRLISILACKHNTDSFNSSQKQKMASRFFNKPPLNADIKEEEQFILSLKNDLASSNYYTGRDI